MFSSQSSIEQSPIQESILSECIEKFSYANINTATGEEDAITHLNWEAFPNALSIDFISLNKNKNMQMMERDEGLKLHISLANIEDNIKKGWDVLIKHIIKNNIINCKVIRDHLRNKMMINQGQSGKEVTIYIYKNIEKSEKDWEKIIQDITEDLANNKIIPGPKPSSDNEINGCNYISFKGRMYFSQPQPMNLESMMETEKISPEPPEDSSAEDDQLLADTNIIRIQRALGAIFNPNTSLASDSSDSPPSSPSVVTSESDAKSESSEERDINVPFKTTIINVPNQPQRVTLKNLKSLYESMSSEESTEPTVLTDNFRNLNRISRTSSIRNFGSFQSSIKPDPKNEVDGDLANDKKLTR